MELGTLLLCQQEQGGACSAGGTAGKEHQGLNLAVATLEALHKITHLDPNGAMTTELLWAPGTSPHHRLRL